MTRGSSDRQSPRTGVVVGRRPSLEAVRSGAVVEVLVSESAHATSGLRELLEAAGSTGVKVRRVAPEEVAALAGGARHQGVAARIAVPRPLGERDLARHGWSPDAVVLVLDGVADPRNVGSVARSAEAAGASAMVLRRRRSAGITAAALRTSAGALLHLPVVEVANLPRALERLKEAGFWIVGLDARGPGDLTASEPPQGRLALVLGSEGEGLSRLVRVACDELLAIPLRGKVASLNVSVAAGVALFAYALRRGPSQQES